MILWSSVYGKFILKTMQQVLSHIQLLCHSFVIIFTRKMIKFKAKVAPGLVYMKRLKYWQRCNPRSCNVEDQPLKHSWITHNGVDNTKKNWHFLLEFGMLFAHLFCQFDVSVCQVHFAKMLSWHSFKTHFAKLTLVRSCEVDIANLSSWLHLEDSPNALQTAQMF